MGFPWQAATAAALAGGALFTYYQHGVWSRVVFIQASAALWFAVLILRLIWSTFIYPHFVSPLRHVPTPKDGHWLLGHGMKIIQSAPGAPMREWATTIPNEGLIRYFWFFNGERILVTSPKSLAEVLVTNVYAFRKPANITASLGRILGFGILLAEGEEHKRQRRNLNPAFAFRHIKDLYPIFWDKSREVVRAITAACGSKGFTELEVGDWASRVTLDIIGLAGLGKDFHAIEDRNNELVKTYDYIFKPTKAAKIMNVLGTIFPAWFLGNLPVKRNSDLKAAAKSIRAVCRDLIQEKKAKLANKEQPDADILSVALESGEFTDENLVDQLMTFLAAGHETTTRSLTWAVYMMCRFPEMQTRLRKEVRERLPSTDTEVSISSVDIDRMPYLNAFCNEVLRYYCPVPVTIREAAHDTTIQGYPVRKGVRIMLVPWAINVDPQLWGPDAGEFNPERWMTVEGATAEENQRAASGGATSNYAFMTFLHGPRSCIGSNFAKSEFACLLAAWVGRFEFELVDKSLMDEKNMEIKLEVTARPAKGLMVRVAVLDEY
ncbi:Cytochrome P450 monooxygenase FUM15 [Cladobotryum mycophilum]|uniref:Cytochrome P450 monooxygenase FUM15 n=1 Tax=Cladobotryum mycophilum TaxID=491253 RepID=A0ABR0SFW8_9HYPO